MPGQDSVGKGGQRAYLGHHAPAGLLGRFIGDPLVADPFLFKFLGGELDHAALGQDRHQGIQAQFHGFLQDQLHFTRLRQPLVQGDPMGRLPSMTPDSPIFSRYFSPSILAAPRR